MYYCENCYLLNEDDVCAFCGSRLTRGPKADDYCFIGTKTSPWAEMLQGILEDDHLPVIVRQWSRARPPTPAKSARGRISSSPTESLITPGSSSRS